MNKQPIIAGLLLALALPAAQAKVALVIGNDAYTGETFKALDNAISDAKIIAEKLRGLGYEVIEKHDLTKSQINDVIEEFRGKLKKDKEAGVFYYAGHGLQFMNINYLIPIQNTIEQDWQAETQAVSFNGVLNAMASAGTQPNIVILDACRDNGLVSRGSKRGLTRVGLEKIDNIYLLFSTKDNTSAYDGVFVEHLKNWLDQPNLSISEMFNNVRDEVGYATNKSQIPTAVDNLNDTFYFNGSAHRVAQAVIPPTPAPTPITPSQPSAPLSVTTPIPVQTPSQLPFEPPMVAIKGDCSFQMGSPTTESDRDSDERQHEVCIDDFEIGQYEVTKGQFAAFVAATHYQTEAEKKDDSNNWRNPGYSQTDQHPVVYVSWNDANAYINWLNQQTHKNYHLPSEAQWEYAARAGTQSPFHTGNCINTQQANYDGNYDYNNCGAKTGVYKASTVAVGSYPANRWRLYDMAGNVWEWTCSVYDKDYAGGEKQCPSSNDANSLRVLRGGSWDFPSGLRPADRGRDTSDFRNYDLGFRLSRM